MQIVNIHDAKTHFSKLIEAVAQGAEIIIAKAGKPTPRLLPIEHGKKPIRHFGRLKGKIKIADDFNQPLTDDIIKEFEGN